MDHLKVIMTYQMYRKSHRLSYTSGISDMTFEFTGDLLEPTIKALHHMRDDLQMAFAPEGELVVTALDISFEVKKEAPST